MFDSCLFVFIGKYFVICNDIKLIKGTNVKLLQKEGYIETPILCWIKCLSFNVLAKQVVSKFKVNLQMACEFYVLFHFSEK